MSELILVASGSTDMLNHYMFATNGMTLIVMRAVAVAFITLFGLWMTVSAVGEWTSGENTLYQTMWITVRISIYFVVAGLVLINMLEG